MALIECPECGKEVSDKSEVCIHCGYPIAQQSKTCIVNGISYDLSFLLDKSYSLPFKVRDLIQISKSSISHVKPVVEKIIETNEIPKTLHLPIQTEAARDSNKPKCPTCNSTNITKIDGLERAGSVAMWGLFSKKINKTFKCNNCGYTW